MFDAPVGNEAVVELDDRTPRPRAVEPASSDAEATPAGEATETTTSTFTNLDPNSLPPELRSFYDSMLKDYRQKTEEISEQKKKAALLESAANDPIVRGQLIAALQGLGGVAEQEEKQSAPAAANPYEGVNPAEFFDEPTFKNLQAWQHQFESQKIAPLVQTIQEILAYKPFIDQLVTSQTENHWTQLEAKYPQARGQREAVEQFRQRNPGLNHEQALFAVLGSKLVAPAGTVQKDDNPADKRATLTTRGGPTVSSQQPKAKQRVSLADLIRRNQVGSR